MKFIMKKSYLLFLSLLWLFLMVWIVSITNWILTKIETNLDEADEHKVILHSLYLSGEKDDEVLMGTITGVDSLNLFNWLVVVTGDDIWGGKFSTIGWWLNNKIYSSVIGWGIWWWTMNIIESWVESAIGGGSDNKANWIGSMIVWGQGCYVDSWWIVLWWSYNHAFEGGVVLWGSGNVARRNSLILWQNASWWDGSFAWNAEANNGAARINADSWVLIWTYGPINGVSLVVGWSVKLSNGNDVAWAIRFNGSWCLTVYDGSNSHILGKSSESNCAVESWCQFGWVLIQNGDFVTGYSVSYSTDCSAALITGIVCEDWLLSWWSESTIYPYCYGIDSNPILNL